MSQSTRQSELFTGEDWTVLYRAFSEINFNAYDPASINRALQEYLQTNYPEDFNDWIESSEFVAIVDLLSWLAGSLAFRTDVNARENFLESAQAKESVLRLARFLSYNPKRAQSGRGLLKITDIKTSQHVIDSLGTDIGDRYIRWNDPDNPEWFEQFTTILNSATSANNPFGIPLKSERVGVIPTQLYALNTIPIPNCVFKFDTVIDGTSETFEIVNADFNNVGFTERTPNPSNLFHLVYRNDGRGNSSERTGFFMHFKQGTLHQKTWSITERKENRVIDVTGKYISEPDVWVQTLNDNDEVVFDWDKVPAIISDNITFNDLGAAIRHIFSVITKNDDAISLRFSDGRFGNVPIGNIRTWYRTLNGKQYQINPREMKNITINIPYLDNYDKRQTLTLKMSLQEPVANAVGPETIEQIKYRAPQVYATQNRMVSGEDYNAFPLSTNEITKLRAINRVYSGHSRYMDIHDPTSNYQGTSIFSNDGVMYKDPNAKQYTQVSENSNYTTSQIILDKIQPMLNNTQVKNYVNDYVLHNAIDLDLVYDTESFIWQSISSDSNSSTGYLKGDITGSQVCSGVYEPYALSTAEEQASLRRYINISAILRFEWEVDGVKQSKWASIIKANIDKSDDMCLFAASIIKKDNKPIVIDDSIPNGAVLKQIIPSFRGTIDTREMIRSDLGKLSEMKILEEFITMKRPFDLWYVFDENSKVARTILELPGKWITTNLDETEPSGNALKVLTGRYTDGVYWSFETNIGLRFVFESVKDVVWSNMSEYGAGTEDTISIIWPDYSPNGNQVEDIEFDIVDNIYYPDGLHDFRKVEITPADSDKDGVVDLPNSFEYVVGDDDFALFTLTKNSLYDKRTPVKAEQFDDIPEYYRGDIVFVKTTKMFYRWKVNKYIEEDQTKYTWSQGKSGLRFKWQHNVGDDHRIDPAVTNVIDMFVLTTEYDMLTRQWVKNGDMSIEAPPKPTILELKNRFGHFNKYKMVSDQLIWRPVTYKFIFGEKSKEEFRAKFKVIKLPSTSMSDGEIKSKVISVINDFFDVGKWEFGETFFFTELAAYIHYQMVTILSSVVIVPNTNNGKFGEMFEMKCDPNEMFLSTAQVDDVIIISSNTVSNLRI